MLTDVMKAQMVDAVARGEDLLDTKFKDWWKNVIDVDGQFDFSSWTDCLLGKCSKGPRQPERLWGFEDPSHTVTILTGRSWVRWLFEVPVNVWSLEGSPRVKIEMVKYGFESPEGVNGWSFEFDEDRAYEEREHLKGLWVQVLERKQREEGYEPKGANAGIPS